jgi:antitoxin YefM
MNFHIVHATNVSNLRTNLKQHFDSINSDLITLIVTRNDDKNVVALSEKNYHEMINELDLLIQSHQLIVINLESIIKSIEKGEALAYLKVKGEQMSIQNIKASHVSYFRNNIKKELDQVTKEKITLLITRSDDKNVVIITQEVYDQILRDLNNLHYEITLLNAHIEYLQGNTLSVDMDALIKLET